MNDSHQESVAVNSAAEHEQPSILNPDVTMLILTWVTFFLLLAVLQKFAWKPIVTALENREKSIRQSLDDADKAKAQLAQIEQTKIQIINDAKTQANDIITSARKAATEVSHQIEQKAKEQADAIIASAHEEIKGERERVRNALKKESAQTAIVLAEKILKENLDTEKNRRLIDDAIKGV